MLGFGWKIHIIGASSILILSSLFVKYFCTYKSFIITMTILSSSNLNQLLMLLSIFYTFLGGFQVLIFKMFGRLRQIEIEHLYEKLWFSLMDTLLALTIFRDTYDLVFLLRFTILLFIKVFHWILLDRFYY